MRKDIKITEAIFPMPVLMVAKVTAFNKKFYPELQQVYCADPNSGACPFVSLFWV